MLSTLTTLSITACPLITATHIVLEDDVFFSEECLEVVVVYTGVEGAGEDLPGCSCWGDG